MGDKLPHLSSGADYLLSSLELIEKLSDEIAEKCEEILTLNRSLSIKDGIEITAELEYYQSILESSTERNLNLIRKVSDQLYENLSSGHLVEKVSIGTTNLELYYIDGRIEYQLFFEKEEDREKVKIIFDVSSDEGKKFTLSEIPKGRFRCNFFLIDAKFENDVQILLAEVNEGGVTLEDQMSGIMSKSEKLMNLLEDYLKPEDWFYYE